MKFLLLLIFLVSCGKQTLVEGQKFPVNEASKLESDKLEDALAIIQEEFDRQGIKVDLKALPYSVSDIDAYGICYYKNSGKPLGIALNHELFENTYESSQSYGLLFKVLAHEIGHCFFDRRHDESYFKVEGYKLKMDI